MHYSKKFYFFNFKRQLYNTVHLINIKQRDVLHNPGIIFNNYLNKSNALLKAICLLIFFNITVYLNTFILIHLEKLHKTSNAIYF